VAAAGSDSVAVVVEVVAVAVVAAAVLNYETLVMGSAELCIQNDT
jgi:hypothetical protein